jgi:hypothetical protein
VKQSIGVTTNKLVVDELRGILQPSLPISTRFTDGRTNLDIYIFESLIHRAQQCQSSNPPHNPPPLVRRVPPKFFEGIAAISKNFARILSHGCSAIEE